MKTLFLLSLGYAISAAVPTIRLAALVRNYEWTGWLEKAITWALIVLWFAATGVVICNWQQYVR